MQAAAQAVQRVGKRQIRPNLTRTDFGYSERTRVKPKKVKRDDDDEETGGEGRARSDRDARNLTVNFTKLDMATLKKYKRHYKLKTRQNATKTELAQAVAKHFAGQTVDEADAISLFMYSRAGTQQYSRRDYLSGR